MTILIPKQNRNAGVYRAAPRDSDLLPNGTILATALMDAADIADPALLITMGVEANDTPGAGANDPGWYILTAVEWRGGTPSRDGLFHPPSAGYSTDTLTAQRLRPLAMISKRISVGLDVTVS